MLEILYHNFEGKSNLENEIFELSGKCATPRPADLQYFPFFPERWGLHCDKKIAVCDRIVKTVSSFFHIK